MATPPADDLPPAELPPDGTRYDAERENDSPTGTDSPTTHAEVVTTRAVRATVLERSTGQRLVAELARRPAVVAGASAAAALGARALVGILARRAVRTLVAQQTTLAQPTALVVNVVIMGAGHDE